MPVVANHPAGTAIWSDLSTGNMEAVQSFYAGLFGWTFKDQGPEFGHYHIAYKHEHPVAGLMAKTPEVAEYPSAWTIYYASNDASADAGRIKELGGAIVAEPMPVGPLGHMVIATDPTGASFGLWQPLEFWGSALEAEHGSMAWQEVNTRDSKRALEFYTQLFSGKGEAVTVETMPGATIYHTMKKDGRDIGGILQMDHQWGDMPPHWMLYFAVDDIAQSLEVAKAHGGRVGVPPFETPYGTIAVLADPDGAHFSVVQLPNQA